MYDGLQLIFEFAFQVDIAYSGKVFRTNPSIANCTSGPPAGLRYHSTLLGNRYLHGVTCEGIHLEESIHEQGTIYLLSDSRESYLLYIHGASRGSLPCMRD